MILSSSFLSLPRPLCRDALWRERGAVSDGRGAWCATASRRRPVEPEVVFLGDNCAASRIFEPRGAPPGTRGARRGFRRRAPRTHLGTVGGARVPRGRRNECHAREPRRALEHRHSFSSLPKPKKKSFQRDSNPVRPRLGFCRTWRARTSVNFLSHRPCPRPLVFPCLQETDGRGNVRVP